MVKDFVFCTAMYESGDWESAQLLPGNLLDSMARYTTLPVAPSGVAVPLSSSEIFEYPFVWLTGHQPVRFTVQERRNLKNFVERGGFMMVDDHNHNVDGVFHKTATEELMRLFGPLKTVPKTHEIYHCCFEFSDGPPATQQELNGWGDQLMHKELFCIYNGEPDRIGVLYSNKDYSSEWNTHPDTKRFFQIDPTRFGVNLIIYALTR